MLNARNIRISIACGVICCGIMLGGIALFGSWSAQPLSAQTVECATGESIEVTLAANSTWDLCWSLSDAEGILLHQIHFTTPDGIRRKVIKTASVAQVIITPDDGSPAQYILSNSSEAGGSGRGLGGDRLVRLSGDHCPSGQIRVIDSNGLLCQQVVQRGYLYRYFEEQRQGEYLSLYALSQLDGSASSGNNSHQILVEWRFYDDGTIEPRVASAGDPISAAALAEQGGYVITAFWRLDIDIGANGSDDVVEQFEILNTDEDAQREISGSAILTETARSVAPNTKRTWRVRAGTLANIDSHLLSYQLEARNVGHRLNSNSAESWRQHQLYVTVLNECERLAIGNRSESGPEDENACGEDISQFVNGESLVGQDPVLWYAASAHHIPEATGAGSPRTEWLSFQLVPRDWSAVNQFVE